MKDEKPKLLYERLKEYADSDFYPFHMPGHKRKLYPFNESYSIDITEIDGFDDFHHPEGVLRDAMDHTAAIYGADASYFLVNGSTGGILSAISAAADISSGILVARNCHKSVYHAIFLKNLKPYYVYPQKTDYLGIAGGILPGDVEKSLKNHPEISAVVLVSPTYEGIVSDVGAIAKICHCYGIPLIVDEAHGAHFPFWREGPRSALEWGADCVIQSLHKTLPALTQTAVLHWRQGFLSRDRLEQYLHIYQSSSPSYVFMASIQSCLTLMENQGRKQMELHGDRMKQFLGKCQWLKKIRLLDESVVGRFGIFDWDWTRVVMMTDGHRGEELYSILRDRYHLQMEMKTPDYVVAITSIADDENGLNRLYHALKEIDQEWRKETDECCSCADKHEAEILRQEIHMEQEANLCPRVEVPMTPYEASLCPTETVFLEQALGRIAAETAYIYPPGIPFIMPGEQIDIDHLRILSFYHHMGFQIRGLKDPAMRQLQVIERFQENG